MNMPIKYADLPVSEQRAAIQKAILENPVVIVEGDTGSGKTTQIPKMILELAHTNNWKNTIGVTQPRRIAALGIASRLREELEQPEWVSTKIRFFEEGERGAPIKVMTDGILLQEYRKDPLLRQYSAIMLDEAHERSLNVDILLGVCKRIVQHRKDFKLIVTSATIDTQTFSSFFNNAPVIQCPGRTYPVTIEYRDNCFSEDTMLQDCMDAVLDLCKKPDNMLCFLPTERDILELRDMLRNQLEDRFEILPLFGRMSAEDQRKIFRQNGKIRIVLATNIAETSVTIPGIAYVVDSGYARLSRYNPQTRVQGLPVEQISKASARQRSGRAGRVKPGVCIRVYSQENYQNRPDYTDPEILRSNLANVVLQLRSLRLPVEHFPFLSAPPKSAFTGAYKLLYELGALEAPESRAHVTPTGFKMSTLPMDVTLAKMLLFAQQQKILQPVLVVSSALGLQDVRIHPQDEKEKYKARESHARWQERTSDFVSILLLWNSLAECIQQEGTGNKLRQYCKANFLSYVRVREWVELYKQFGRLVGAPKQLQLCAMESMDVDLFHKCMLSGYLGNVAKRSEKVLGAYILPGNREAWVFPGSALKKRRPDWVLSAELRETSRLFLSVCAELQPAWIETIAPHLCTYTYYGELYNEETGYVETHEEVKYKGLVLMRGRRKQLEKINPELSAEIFWYQAIVLKKCKYPFTFIKHNQTVLKQLQILEERTRQFGLCPTEEVLTAWYCSRAGDICSVNQLKKRIEKTGDAFLQFEQTDWMGEKQSREWREAFSNHIKLHSGKKAKVEFAFDHTKEDDGASLDVPDRQLNTPAEYCLQLTVWKKWIIDHAITYLHKQHRQEMELHRLDLEQRVQKRLQENRHHAAAYSVFWGFSEVLGKEVSFSLPKKYEAHHSLHLRLGQKRVDIEPEMGINGALLAFKHALLNQAIHNYWVFTVPHGKWFLSSYNCCLTQNQCEMDWLHREGMRQQYEHNANSKISGELTRELPKETQEKLQNKLSFLEGLGAVPMPILDYICSWEKTSTDFSTMTNSQIDKVFSFFDTFKIKKTKIKTLQDLAQAVENPDEKYLEILVQIAYDSFALGVQAAQTAWETLQLGYKNQLPKPVYKRLTSILDIAANTPLERMVRAQLFLESGEYAAWKVARREWVEGTKKRWRQTRSQVREQLMEWGVLGDPPDGLFGLLIALEDNKYSFAERAWFEVEIGAKMEKWHSKVWRAGYYCAPADRLGQEESKEPAQDASAILKLAKQFGRL
jgi:HrpA-like RNA helicase